MAGGKCLESVGETVHSPSSNAGLEVASDSDLLGPVTSVREISRVDTERRPDNADHTAQKHLQCFQYSRQAVIENQESD